MSKEKDSKADASAETGGGMATEAEEIKTDSPAEDGDTGAELTEREKIYAKYNKDKSEGSNQEAESEGEQAATGESEEDKPAEDKDKDDKETKPEEGKTVPLGALHEERQKRKELQAKNIELEQQVKDILKENKPDKPAGEEEVIDDYDAELIKLKKQNEETQAKLDAILAKGTQSDAQKAQTIFLEKVKKTNSELVEEGFDGFDKCTPLIRQHIHDLIMKEPDSKEYIEGRKLLDVDTPEGWKKIYKEEIYPTIQKIIDQKDKEELIDERIARKKKAALSGSGGGKPVSKKREDINSLSQAEMNKRYMQERENYKRGAAV